MDPLTRPVDAEIDPTPAGVGRMLAALRASRILSGSAWILVGLGIQSGLAFTFWLLGSRVASSADLGRATALFTAIQFVNYASGLGLTVALARHAARQSDDADALFAWSIVATVISSGVIGAAYLAVTNTSAVQLVTGSVGGWVLFCAYTAGTSISLLVDVRLMAARRWGWLVGRVTVISLVRLPLTQIHVDQPDLWLYHLMLAPLALGGVLGIPLLAYLGAGSLRWHRPRLLGQVARYAGVNWAATLSSQAPQFVLPLVVAQSVAASVNANFFLAWSVTGLVFLVPAAISQVLLVEGSKEAGEVDVAQPVGQEAVMGEPDPRRVREALLFSLGLATVAWFAAFTLGAAVTAVFGNAYRSTARLLPGLLLAGIPWAITSVRLSEARIRRDQLATVAITLTLGLGILVPTLLLVPSRHSTLAASRSWLAGNVAAAVVAAVFHQRALRRRSVALA